MKDELLKKVQEAKKQKVEAAQVLWNTRLEILVATGNVAQVLEHLASPVELEDADNCSCNRPCAAAGLLDRVTNPAVVGKR